MKEHETVREGLRDTAKTIDFVVETVRFALKFTKIREEFKESKEEDREWKTAKAEYLQLTAGPITAHRVSALLHVAQEHSRKLVTKLNLPQRSGENCEVIFSCFSLSHSLITHSLTDAITRRRSLLTKTSSRRLCY